MGSDKKFSVVWKQAGDNEIIDGGYTSALHVGQEPCGAANWV